MKRFFIISFVLYFIGLSYQASASESLSYSGRLVNASGVPVAGPVSLTFDFAYTNDPVTILCTEQITNVSLTNGLFHVKLNPNCTPSTLPLILALTPPNETLAIRVKDNTHNNTYSFQALYSMPYANIAHEAKQLVNMGAVAGQILGWDGTKWRPTNAGAGSGTVTNVDTGTGLVGGPITNIGTISIANGGVNTLQLADNAVTTAKIADGNVSDAKIANDVSRTKLLAGSANYVLVNNGTGRMSEVAQLPLSQGGTGANSAIGARANLGLGEAATASIGYGAGDVMPGDHVPVCLPTQKLLFTGIGPTYWSCATDVDTNTDVTKLPLDGSMAMVGILDLGNHKIINVTSPTDPGDVTNKAYVDAEIADVQATIGTSSQWTTTGSDIFYNSGKVGIGTSVPETLLHVSGSNNDDSGIGVSLTNSHSGNRAWSGVDFYNDLGYMGSIYSASSTYLNDSYPGVYAGRMHIESDDSHADGITIMARKSTGDIRFVTAGDNNERMRIQADGDVAFNSKIRLRSDNTNYVEHRAPGGLASTLTFTWPGSHGTNGYALTTDGAGNLNWSAVSTSSSSLGGNLSGTIASASINDDTITSEKIVDGTIIGADLADGTLPYAKLNLTDGDIPSAKVNGLDSALSGKEPTIAAGATTQYWRGDKTWQTLDTDAVPEGATNRYFDESLVRNTPINSYVVGTAIPLAPTDTVLEAFGKLEAQIIANATAFNSTGQWSKNGTSVYYNGGNVGIGTSAPTEKLIVDGNVRANRLMVDGVAYMTTSAATGGDDIGLFAGNVERMSIMNTGNVGIGTTSPLSKLHIAGGDITLDTDQVIKTTSASGSTGMYGGSASNNGGYFVVRGSDYAVADQQGQVQLYGDRSGADPMAGAITFGTHDGGLNYITNMLIDKSGKIGIGTSTPGTILEIAHDGSSTTDGRNTLSLRNTRTSGSLSNRVVFMNDQNTNVWEFANDIGRNGGEDFYISYNSISEFMIDGPTRNVGIGTFKPAHKLDVNSPSFRFGAYVDDTNLLRTNAVENTLYISRSSAAGPNTRIGTGYEHKAIIAAQETTQYGVGQGALIMLRGLYTSLGSMGSNLDTSPGANVELYFKRAGTPGPSPFTSPTKFSDDTTVQTAWTQFKPELGFILNSAGNVGIGTTAPSYKLDVTGDLRITGTPYRNGGDVGWTVPSDARLKRVTGSYSRGLKEISKLNTIKFRYKVNNNKGISPRDEFTGVLAQEVQRQIPEAVKVESDGYLSMNTTPIFWAMINAIKELEAENKNLKARADKTEKEMKDIKAYLCLKDKTPSFCR